MMLNKKILFLSIVLFSFLLQLDNASCYANTIFVPRQMAYNAIYENAMIFDQYTQLYEPNDYKENDNQFIMSVKPIYNQTVGKALKTYFNINRACSMYVDETGAGDIDPLWFQVISAPNSYYSSNISFNPVQKSYGALFYFATWFNHNFSITFNTAVIKRTTNICMCETDITNAGQVNGFSTMTQALSNTDMRFGRVCGQQCQVGFDDFQIKFIKNFKKWIDKGIFWDIYGLVGIPTGQGSQARFLFEPLVGSPHVQVGLGLNMEKKWEFRNDHDLGLYSEAKWRYGLKAIEMRSFDMLPNGQWSRYMLFTTPSSPSTPFFAINELTLQAQVTPRSSVDFILGLHYDRSSFCAELGYNLWYRQAELVCPCSVFSTVGIADLVGIAQLQNQDPVTVTSSSQATISEAVLNNQYQMPRDSMYTVTTVNNLNLCSAAQPQTLTNAIYGGLGYNHNGINVSINAAYEIASNKNSVSNVSAWLNVDVAF